MEAGDGCCKHYYFLNLIIKENYYYDLNFRKTKIIILMNKKIDNYLFSKLIINYIFCF